MFDSENVFATPKPERLIERVLRLATNPGDWVLDSFLGSGTTAAVAHKMGRRWVGIELGAHAHTHCLPRLRKVVSGADQGGISKATGWQGGGGFRFYSLAPTLLRKDSFGNDIINPEYNAQMLAAAMAKHEGYRYAPDPAAYWRQAAASEKSYLYTTTQFLTAELLDRLAAEMEPGEQLLICCKSHTAECSHRHANIQLRKIPQMLLGRCEFGRDDYSFTIVNLPFDPPPPSPEDLAPVAPAPEPEPKKKDTNQTSLFS